MKNLKCKSATYYTNTNEVYIIFFYVTVSGYLKYK